MVSPKIDHRRRKGLAVFSGLPLRTVFFIVVLLSVALFQSYNLMTDFILKLGRKVWEVRAMSAQQRTAILHNDLEFARYIEFLQDNVPEDARMILPPHTSYHPLSNFGFADYFFMPRELHNCGADEIEECILRLTGSESYVIVAGKFPPPEVASQVKRFISFDGELGVWAPK
jgi:hypothetical protein